MSDIIQEKKRIRKEKIALRRAQTLEEQNRKSNALCRKILESEIYQKSTYIMAYRSMPGEVSLDLLVEEAKKDGKKVGFPLCISKQEMECLIPNGEDTFRRGAYGIQEPDPEKSEKMDPKMMDLILLPCTAFDEECRRLGMGAGYYDRYLEKCKKAHLAAVAFELQKERKIPVQKHDKAVEAVFTEDAVYRRREKMSIREDVAKMKKEAPFMAASTVEMRNAALRKIQENLQAGKEKIFAANEQDIEAAKEAGIADAVMKRLKFNEGKLADVLAGIEQLISLADPLGKTSLARQLDEGLQLYRVSCPIGVIGVIFEARPDALVQISSLCIKSGNCAVLKGGKETAHTNRVLFDMIQESIVSAGLPKGALLQAQQHSEIDELLDCHESVDLLIPRGSNAFVQYIMNHTKIPVMGHADGICHIYVDQDADLKKAIPIIIDAKTQYTAACNAVETLLIHEKIAETFLPQLAKALREEKVKILGTGRVGKLIELNETIEESDFKEYLDLAVSVKLVKDVDEAIEHINKYGSHHTDAIITENAQTAEHFMQMVDSAGVYQNCSTRFADGFRYGFGAEVGISTGKIHARGPVGLEGLVTYKYKLYGAGHIVGDYASGKKSFHFKDL